MQLDKAIHSFHSKDMQRTESLKQTLNDLKELMSSELKNHAVSGESDQLTTGKRVTCPNVIMNERHKMVRNRSKPLQTKLFQTPAELKFVSAKKSIREENLKILLHEKEKRFVAKAIIQLEREFSSRRNSATLSLPDMEKQKKGSIHEVCNKEDKNKNKDPADFLINIQKAYEKLNINLLRVQHFKETLPETTLQERSIENFVKLSPITPKDKANTDNESRNENVGNAVSGKKTFTREKSVKPVDSLEKVDNCQCQKNGDILLERLDIKKPEDGCENKITSAEEEKQWKLLYFWTVWRMVTLKSRKENHKLTRIKKIDSFLTRLTKAAEQVQKLEKLADTVEKIQKKPSKQSSKRKKSISKTEENQKIDKLEKELTESAIEAHEHLQRSLKRFHPNLKPKLKALSILTNIKQKCKNVGTETRKVYPKPAFLVEMESRYNERKQRWDNIRKRRSEMEAEKERIMKEREEEERRMEDIKKREKLEELKEKRRKEKEAEQERKRERRLLIQQLRLAEDHYARYLMREVGFQSWRRLVQLRRSQMESAHNFSQISRGRRFLTYWRTFARLQLEEKYRKAQDLHEKILMKSCLRSWILNHYEYVQKIQVAIDWEEAKLSEKTFAIWVENARAERWYFMRRMEIAESFHERKTLVRFFKKWKEFPELVRNEKEKEKRKKLWQRKVQEFLPDYQPAFVS